MKKNLSKAFKMFGIYSLILLAICFSLSILCQWNDFSVYEYKKFVNSINDEVISTRKNLFTKYEDQIDTKKYPKTFKEYLIKQRNFILKNKINTTKFDQSIKDEYTRALKWDIKVLDTTVSDIFYNEAYTWPINYPLTKKSLIKELDPYPSKKKIIKGGLRDFIDNDYKNQRVYYNDDGKLIYIEKLYDDYNIAYRYNSKGSLVESELSVGESNTILNRQKKFKYSCDRNICVSAKDLSNIKNYRFNQLNYIFFFAFLIFIIGFILTAPIFLLIMTIGYILTNKKTN